MLTLHRLSVKAKDKAITKEDSVAALSYIFSNAKLRFPL